MGSVDKIDLLQTWIQRYQEGYEPYTEYIKSRIDRLWKLAKELDNDKLTHVYTELLHDFAWSGKRLAYKISRAEDRYEKGDIGEEERLALMYEAYQVYWAELGRYRRLAEQIERKYREELDKSEGKDDDTEKGETKDEEGGEVEW